MTSTILAEIIANLFLGTFLFAVTAVLLTEIFLPEDFLCNLAATDVSLFGREHAKHFAL